MVTSKGTHQYLRYDPERTDFTVTEAELEILERGNAPLWKDVFLFSFPLAASTLFNAYGEGKAQTGEAITFTIAHLYQHNNRRGQHWLRTAGWRRLDKVEKQLPGCN